MSLFEVIGRSIPGYLLADPQGAELIAIPCEPGNGVIKRGTVVYRKSNGMYAAAANAQVTATNMLAVIDETVDTDANANVAENARAYRAGRLIYGKVTLASDAALSAANMVVLRGQNIVFDQMDATAPEVGNGKAVITYKANGGTGDDVVVKTDLGGNYAIAANAFTAPASKSFKKWNTKADGSGTDYAAAANYTANEDLTLFAIWG
nr:MAG TPA: hypothetical protein [Caudoviricetes sp.]